MTAQIFDPSTVALLGLGEAGTALARGLVEQSGWRRSPGDNGRRLIAVDTALGEGPRGAAIAERAKDFGIAIARDYATTLRDAELVISVVTGTEAMNAATEAKPHLRSGAVYCDFNTLTRKNAEDIGATLRDAGIEYIDVAVMGGFNALGYKVPLLLAGSAAPRVLAWMAPLGFEARVLSDRIGDASAVKILRSILLKGLEALSVECLVAARQQGVLEQVLGCLGDVDRVTFAGMVKELAITHLAHAKRRMEEVEKVNETLRETGIEPLMSDATRRNHARTVAANVAPADGSKPTLDEALRLLTERVVKPRAV